MKLNEVVTVAVATVLLEKKRKLRKKTGSKHKKTTPTRGFFGMGYNGGYGAFSSDGDATGDGGD
jgi:hypothetical protein